VKGLIVGKPQVFVETDWHEADGAILTPDDRVVPMAHLGEAIGPVEFLRLDQAASFEIGDGSQPNPAAD
jgi:hypothetical protein